MNKNVLKSFEVSPGVHGTPTMIQFIQSLWDQNYSGPTVVHWLHGRPQAVFFQTEGVMLKLEIVKPKRHHEPKSLVRQAKAPWNSI
jgi:hypothetical protein